MGSDRTGPARLRARIMISVKPYPYSGYEQYEFDVPTATEGDVYARYRVHMAEMHQSIRIVQQALDKLPIGPVRSNNRKFVPPPRAEIGVSMEALIHHFKLWTEGFSLPKGATYMPVESPRGELGVYLESNGSNKPQRVHYRAPPSPPSRPCPSWRKGTRWLT